MPFFSVPDFGILVKVFEMFGLAEGRDVMSRKTQMNKAKPGLAVVWAVAGVFFFGHLQVVAIAAEKEKPAAEGVTRLPVGKADPLHGGLSISSDGRTAAHIGANGAVVLWEPASGRQLETIPAIGKVPSAVALSADGDLVAIGYQDSRVALWSRRARKVVREFSGHARWVSALAFSPDGRMLATGADDATTQIWEVHTGRRIRVFDSRYGTPVGNTGGVVVALGFSGDGHALIVNEWYSGQYSVERGFTVWDIDGGIEISTRQVAPPNTDKHMRAGQASGGRGWLLAYTGSEGLMVERLDVCESRPLKMPPGKYADTVAVDAQGRWVAASEIGRLTFFGMSGDMQGLPVELPENGIALAAHPDGRSVFALLYDTRGPMTATSETTCDADGKCTTKSLPRSDQSYGAIYRVAVPEPLWRLPPMTVKPGAAHCAPSAAVRAVQDFRLPDKPVELPVVARLAPQRLAQRISQWLPDSMAAAVAPVDVPPGPALELRFARDGNLYARYELVSENQSYSGVAVWDPRAQRPLRARYKKYGGNRHWRLRESWAEMDHEALYDMLTGKPILRLRKTPELETEVITSDQDTGDVYRIVLGRIERYAADGRRLPDVPTDEIKPVNLTARNGRLAVLGADYRVQVWQIGSGAKPRIHGPLAREGNCDILELTLSPDGRYLQTEFNCGDGGTMYWMLEFESARWVPAPPFIAPLPARANRAVVPDERMHRLAVWDVGKAQVIARLPRHPMRDKKGNYRLPLAAISDDGKYVASASHDGSVRVWDLDARRLLGEVNIGGAVTAVAFDAAGRQLAASREDGQLVVLQVPARPTLK